MKWEYWVYGIGSLILLIIVIGIGYWFLKRRFTRERFVFVAFSVHSFHATTIILELLSVPSLTEFLIVSAQKWGFNLPFIKPSIEYIIGSTFIWLCLMIYSYLVFNKWNSPIKTTRQAQEEKEQLKASILADFSAEFKHMIGLEKLELYTGEKDKENKRKLLNQVDTTPLAWHRNAAELLPLIGKYHIDEDKDWHPERKCFISTYGKKERPVCIYCIHTASPKNDYSKLIHWLQQEYTEVNHIVVMVEDGNQPKKTIQQSLLKITIYYKANLLDNLIDVSDYQRKLHQLFYKEGIMGTDITLNDIYVPLDYKKDKDDKERKALQPFIQDWLDKDKSNRHLALLGEYGQGKSVQSLRLALDLLEAKHPRIPLLITLGGLSPRTLNPLSLLGGWGGHYDLKAKALLKLHREGRLLLIFDGFDEMDLAGDPEMRFQHFETLWQFAKSPKAKILITGRPNFFLDNAEEKRSLGIDRPAHPNSSYCAAIHLHKMAPQQMEQALRATDSEVRQSILTTIAKNPKGNLEDLASRPVTLFQISCVWEPAKFHEYKNKLYSATIIKEFVQFSYERQELKKNKTFLTIDERHYFMQGIAVAMVNEDKSKNQISPESLREIVSYLYDNIPDELPSTSNSHQASRKPLKERTKEAPSPKESALIDVCACGLLITDPINGHGFKFAHKSFLEYLFSDFCAAKLLGGQEKLVAVFDTLYTTKKLGFSVTTFDLTAELIADKYDISKDHKETAIDLLYSLTNSRLTTAILSLFALTIKIKKKVGTAKLKIVLFSLLVALTKAKKILSIKIISKALVTSLAWVLVGFWIEIFLKMLTKILEFSGDIIQRNKASLSLLLIFWYLSCIKMGISKDVLHNILPSKYLEKIIDSSKFTRHLNQDATTPPTS